MLWITSNTNYINPKQTPSVEFIEQSKLSELACGSRECEIMAYTPIEPKYKVYLADNLDQMKEELQAYSTTIYDYNMASNRTNREGFSSVSFS